VLEGLGRRAVKHPVRLPLEQLLNALDSVAVIGGDVSDEGLIDLKFIHGQDPV
jgi:hypothetical protein